jgi:hypothetical protein
MGPDDVFHIIEMLRPAGSIETNVKYYPLISSSLRRASGPLVAVCLGFILNLIGPHVDPRLM